MRRLSDLAVFLFILLFSILGTAIITSIINSCNNGGGNEPEVTVKDSTYIEDNVVSLVPDSAKVDTRTIDSLKLVIDGLNAILLTADGESDTIRITDTVTKYITLPVKQTHYSFPDTIDIYISGFMVKLDSINFHFRTVQSVKTIETVRYRRPIFELETGLNFMMCEKEFVPSVFLKGGFTIKQRVKVNIGTAASYSHGVVPSVYGEIIYIIR